MHNFFHSVSKNIGTKTTFLFIMIISKRIKQSILFFIFLSVLYTIVRASWPLYCVLDSPITVLSAFVLADAISGTWLHLFSRYMFTCHFLNVMVLHHATYIADQLHTHICSIHGFPSLHPSAFTPRHLVSSAILYIFNLVTHFSVHIHLIISYKD